MFQKIKRLFRRVKEDRHQGHELADQAEAAKEFRDVLSLAWNLNFPVLLTVRVNGLERSVIVGPGDEIYKGVVEYLYNAAAASRLGYDAMAQDYANRTGSHFGRYSPASGKWAAKIATQEPLN
jgi:hypothetical protein